MHKKGIHIKKVGYFSRLFFLCHVNSSIAFSIMLSMSCRFSNFFKCWKLF
ncbi:hypothetical protein P7631_28 [Streptococcus phage P7631]|uniref:Uncharacterized protein n=1 Tax=Streptococcus phage P7631 TaxID=1971433 RepID=A0A286QQ79_9CAUD|nr:hypothetical protein PP243_gp28 [Streptococcus phage P7631]ARU14071.1 hypothetical protein P7631_28 [Streptococcus phage P7631]